MRNMYELAIIGGGPAGVAAGIYAARKKIKSVIITDMFGGQSVVSADIQNFIGYTTISGMELASKMESQLRAQDGIEIIDGDRVSSVVDNGEFFIVKTEAGKEFEAKTLFVASGSKRRKLDVSGEKEFDGKGVAYCATCDAPMFKDKRVAVVGGGNAALESVLDLLHYASEVSLFYRSSVRGDAVTFEKLKQNPKVKLMPGTEIVKIMGEKMVTGMRYKIKETGEEKEIPLEGVFIEIGWLPNSDLVSGMVNINERKEIIVDHKTQKTSHARIWAAGDVSDVLYKQNNISMGDATKAVLSINEYINTVRK